MTIHLPEHLQQFVHDQVHAGLYSTEEDVISDALEHFRKRTQPIGNSKGSPGAIRSAANEPSHQDVQRRLFEAGLVSEIKPPITDLTPYQNRQAISIQGEPLSETVIRERR
jgi:Arc/MetJ-type ribon-helix-helix transcriptional regulator